MFLLMQASCYFPVPTMPNIEPGCRNFFVTTWADERAPWNDIDWDKIRTIDEPLDPIWGWPGDLNNPNDVCGPIGLQKVAANVQYYKSQGYTVWVNWSTEEYTSVFNFCGAENMAAGADIVSFDDYGGVWDWNIRTHYRLDHMYRNLPANTKMGLVPQGHYAKTWGVGGTEFDRVFINALYFDWALTHQDEGKIFAFAPFTWGPCRGTNPSDPDQLCIADQPMLSTTIYYWTIINPMCSDGAQTYSR